MVTLNENVSIDDIRNTIIHQDLFEVVKYLPEQFADLIVIDPPYNITKKFNDITHKETDDITYINYLESWLSDVVKCLKPNGSIYICSDWKSSCSIYQVLSKYCHIRNRITWQREKERGAKTNWKNSMEDIWYAVNNNNDFYFDVDSVKQKKRVIAPYKENGEPKDWTETDDGKFRLTYPSNFWDDITVPFWSMSENTSHPTQKPEKLIAKLILSSCPENGIVFDPFLGSGTTAVVAKKLNRQYVGIEIDEEYSLLAIKRLLMSDENGDIQGYSDGVFWERNSRP